MLETLREFALERLEDAGERDEIALRHARFFAERLEMEPDIRGREGRSSLRGLTPRPTTPGPRSNQLLASGDEDAALTLAVHLVPY